MSEPGTRQLPLALRYSPDQRFETCVGIAPEALAQLRALADGTAGDAGSTGVYMAGLNCGTLSSLAWPVLRDGCDAAVAVTDDDALRAVEDLATLGVSSGPSGAATLAGVRKALGEAERREALGLDGSSVVVLLSTEARH